MLLRFRQGWKSREVLQTPEYLLSGGDRNDLIAKRIFIRIFRRCENPTFCRCAFRKGAASCHSYQRYQGEQCGRCLAELNNVERAIGIEKSAFPNRLDGAIKLPDVNTLEDITGEAFKQDGAFYGKNLAVWKRSQEILKQKFNFL